MSDVVAVALIATVVPLAGLIVSWVNGRRAIKTAELAARVAGEARMAAEKAAITAEATAGKLDEVHGQINGKMQELLDAKGAEQRAAGEAVGREKAITERQERVTEAERVEDRIADKDRTVPK